MAFIKYTTGVSNYSVEYIECSCQSSEHLIKFHLDEDDGDIFLDFHLASWLPWYGRVWHAFKYIFGYQSKYGAFDSFLLKNEDVDRILKLLTHQQKLKRGKSNEEI